MGLTSRQPRPLDLSPKRPFRDTRLIVVATEGIVTEKQYFEMFDESRVQVKVLEAVESKSDPKHVFRRLDDYRKEFEIGREDQLWLVIDVDRWPKKQLAEVTRGASQKNYGCAISNPCFELWLFLHHDSFPLEPGLTSGQMTSLLRKKMGGYDKNKIKPEKFRPYVEKAIARAREMDISPRQRWPKLNGTRVYKLAGEILCLKESKTQKS